LAEWCLTSDSEGSTGGRRKKEFIETRYILGKAQAHYVITYTEKAEGKSSPSTIFRPDDSISSTYNYRSVSVSSSASSPCLIVSSLWLSPRFLRLTYCITQLLTINTFIVCALIMYYCLRLKKCTYYSNHKSKGTHRKKKDPAQSIYYQQYYLKAHNKHT